MPDRDRQARGKGAARYLVRSAIFLLLLAALGVLFRGPLAEGFVANAYLNGTILGLFGLGVLYTLKVLADTLATSAAVTEAAELAAQARRGDRPAAHVNEVILAPRAGGIGEFLAAVHRVVHHGNTAATLPYLLDSLAVRAEDRRALVRYLTGALVLLGLIGTFYGLLVTIGGVREVIGALSATANTDTVALLTGLKERLAVPLSGMALAFSSSLFGLLASLALAFLELQLFHAQNHVHARLESLVVSDLVPLWLPAEQAPQAAPAHPRYLNALLESAGERLDRAAGALEALAAGDGAVKRVAEQVGGLSERIGGLHETLEAAERDRTQALRQELRLIARSVAAAEPARREAEGAQPAR